MAIYYLMKSDPDPEKIDVDTIEKILKGSISFNTKERFSLLKKYDPTVDNDEYTFSIKNMITNTQYIFIPIIKGFTTEKSIPDGPSKAGISKAKKNLADKTQKALEDAAKAVQEAAEKAAKEAQAAAEKVAKETTQVANTVAKGTTQTANTVAKGVSSTAKKIGNSIKKIKW